MKTSLLTLLLAASTLTLAQAEDFQVTWSQPADGATVATIAKGDTLKFRTTMDGTIKGLKYTIFDVDKNVSIASTFVDTYSSAEQCWYKKNYGSYDLTKGHRFNVIVEGYEEARPSSNLLGSDTIQWIGGGSDPYIYSDISVVSVTPEPGTYIDDASQNTFVITYSAPVEIDLTRSQIVTGQMATAQYESVTANDDKSVWTIVVPQSVVAASTPSLMFNVYVSDPEGHSLVGNRGDLEENSYYKYTYKCLLGSPALTITPAAGEVTSLQDFTLAYEGGIARSYTCNDPILVLNAEDRSVVASFDLDNLTSSGDSMKKMSLPSAITAPGKYILYIPREIFSLGTEFEGFTSKKQEVEYTIPGETGINRVSVDSDNARILYNLSGQRVKESKGIVIEGNKKTINIHPNY